MADTKLTDLTAVTILDETDVLYVVDGGTSKKITVADLRTIADAKGFYDANGNEVLIFNTTASAENNFEMTNAAGGGDPMLAVVGSSDANIDMLLQSKGTGKHDFQTSDAVTAAQLRLWDADNSHYMGVKSPNTVSSNALFTLPGVATTFPTAQPAANDYMLTATTGGVLSYVASPLGQQTIWVPAAAMVATTTNGAASGTAAIATSLIEISTLDFDGSTEEFVIFGIQMPKGWDAGTLIAQFVGSQTGASTNFGVAWGIEAVCIADDELMTGVSWGTEVVTTDTYGTTDDLYISGESTAITVGSTPAAEEMVYFRITRVVGDAGDTMTTADARLHGVKIHYTIDTANDS